MGFLERVFKAFQGESRLLMQRFDQSIQETEKGILRLKKELQTTIISLSEIKSVAVQLRHDVAQEKACIRELERRALFALTAEAKGELTTAEAERKALEALRHQELAGHRLSTLSSDLSTQEALCDRLQVKVDRLRHAIQRLENELITLKARARTAQSVRKINRQLAQVDSGSTIALLERMKQRVIEEESLADAYGDLADIEADMERSIAEQIDRADESTPEMALDTLRRKVREGDLS